MGTTSSHSANMSASCSHTSDLLKNMPPPPPKYEDLEQPPKYEEIAGPAAPAGATGGATAAVPSSRDRLTVENELLDMESILPALEGQERTDCQTRIELLKSKLNENAATAVDH